MTDQAHFWSQAAKSYEQDFLDPYRPDVQSPLVQVLRELADPAHKTVADLGCGIGPLLPLLAERFGHVFAIDFAAGMLERARERCSNFGNVEFFDLPLTDLASLARRVDVAVAVNSNGRREVLGLAIGPLRGGDVLDRAFADLERLRSAPSQAVERSRPVQISVVLEPVGEW